MLVKEIFLSLQGESTSAGLPTVFVRFSGCNLRCRYCDTKYAYEGREELRVEALFERISQYHYRRICLTGGEPLVQSREELQKLLDMLRSYEVSIETNGSLPLAMVYLNPGQRWVMDIKCPGSGEVAANCWENLSLIRPEDEIKFVLSSEDDYIWAKEFIRNNLPVSGERLLFSPAYGLLEPGCLAGWILRDGLDVRLQLQLHKIIFGPESRM